MEIAQAHSSVIVTLDGQVNIAKNAFDCLDASMDIVKQVFNANVMKDLKVWHVKKQFVRDAFMETATCQECVRAIQDGLALIVPNAWSEALVNTVAVSIDHLSANVTVDTRE